MWMRYCCLTFSRLSIRALVDELFDTYDRTLTNVADQFAPERTVTSRLRPLCPWFNAECRATRRNCRRLERRYRRTRDAEEKAAYVQAACRDKHDVFDQKKKQYWSQRINADDSSTTKLWHSLSALLQRNKRTVDDISPTCNDADDFLRFFDDKVRAVRAATDGRQPPDITSAADVSLSTLSAYSEEELRQLIMQSPTPYRRS